MVIYMALDSSDVGPIFDLLQSDGGIFIPPLDPHRPSEHVSVWAVYIKFLYFNCIKFTFDSVKGVVSDAGAKLPSWAESWCQLDENLVGPTPHYLAEWRGLLLSSFLFFLIFLLN